MVMIMVTSESTGVKEDMITYDNSKENQRQVRHPILSPVTRPWLQRTPPNNEAASARSSLKMQPQNSGKLPFKSRRVLDLKSKEDPKRSNATKALAPANEVPTAYILDFKLPFFHGF